MNDRIRPLEGIRNFRDYGGYDTPDGPMVRGTLWRSGQHAGATVADLEAVAGLDFATVIDLRGDGERREMPCLRPDGFCGTVLFEPGETAGTELAPHEEAGLGISTADEAREAMTRLYANMPYRPVLVGTMRLYFEALATREGASLLHCLAGKDRTGLAVALLHRLLGVHEDDVLEDYLLTNVATDPEARLAMAADGMRERYGSRLTDEAIVTLMGVDAAFLDAATRAIADRHGSTERYAEAVLGVDAARREQLRARLIA